MGPKKIVAHFGAVLGVLAAPNELLTGCLMRPSYSIKGDFAMHLKNLLKPLAAFALFTFILGIVLTRLWGYPINDIIVGLFVYAMYGLLLIGFLLRFALIFLGVFAVYKVFKERSHKQFAA
jgi:hypothetical protein